MASEPVPPAPVSPLDGVLTGVNAVFAVVVVGHEVFDDPLLEPDEDPAVQVLLEPLEEPLLDPLLEPLLEPFWPKAATALNIMRPITAITPTKTCTVCFRFTPGLPIRVDELRRSLLSGDDSMHIRPIPCYLRGQKSTHVPAGRWQPAVVRGAGRSPGIGLPDLFLPGGVVTGHTSGVDQRRTDTLLVRT
ncbi:MAG TPA: hypothetical protein VHA73_05850 [Acidimicrobiales bacterium]|jgi:hypothetical protein|nr:hypothetical protein [Acidimicrobiales bacterium]